jgi:hypothetical protein
MKFRHTPSRDEQQAFLDYGDRVVDGDTTPPTSDLESTFLRVQRAMRSSAAASNTMPDHLRMRAWEDVMQNTAIAPARGSTRPVNRPRTIPAVPLSRMAWTGAANIALAILVVIAGFGAWRAFDSGIGGGGNDSAPSEGRYAQAPTTPVPMSTAETHVAAEPISSCDFSENMPIVTAVEYTEYKGTALYLWKGQSSTDYTVGDLVLRCAGEPEDVVLAENVAAASPGPIAGTVQLHRYPDPSTAPEGAVTTYLDVVTGESVTLPTQQLLLTHVEGNWSQWITAIDNEKPDDLIIANLVSMESRTLSELTGVTMNGIGTVTTVATGNTVVVLSRTGTLEGVSDLPGEALVIRSDFSNIRWIDLPEESGTIENAWLSPDGDHLAVSTAKGGQFDRDVTYSILSTEDGQLVSQSEPFEEMANHSVSWIQDGAAIVFSEQHTLRLLPAQEGASTSTLLVTEGELWAPRTTHDPATVTVQEVPMQDDDANAIAGSYATHIVNVESAEMTTLEGRDVNSAISWFTSSTSLAMVMPDEAEPETTSMVFHDPVTGNPILEVEEIPYPFRTGPQNPMLIGKSAFYTTPDGDTTLLTIGSQFMFLSRIVDGQTEVRQLPTLPEPYTDHNSGLSVIVSDDGGMASIIRSQDEAQIRFILDLTHPEAEWLEVPTEEVNTSPNVTFVQAP